MDRISSTAMIGQVLRLHGYLKTTMHIMVLVKHELSSQFITLNLEPIPLEKLWHMLTKLQL